jgi:hypothetical protein
MMRKDANARARMAARATTGIVLPLHGAGTLTLHIAPMRNCRP